MSNLLLEREKTLEKMRAALAQVRQGAGRTLLLSGEAGIGKTTVVSHFVQEQQTADCRVLWGACESLFTPRTLGPLVDFATQLDPSVLRAIAAADGSTSIFSAFLADLSASSQPTLILFEDVHWADHATLDLIKFLGRRISRVSALLVMTYREDELPIGHPLLAVLGELPSAQVERLPLAPLSRQAVHQLELDSGRVMVGLFEKTNGNPFYVTEVLASAGQEVPRNVHDAVLARLGHLSDVSVLLCERVSVTPGSVELALLKQSATLSGVDVDRAIDECVQAGVLQIHGDTLRFRHELARLAVHEVLLPQRRRHLHADALQALLDYPGATKALVVYHAVEAGDLDKVREFAPLAGAEAARLGAHREAAAHYGVALSYAQNSPLPMQADLNEKWSYEAGISLAINDDVLAARQRAINLWRQLGNQEREGLNLRWLSRLHWYRGEKKQADALAAQAIDVLERLAPTAELAMAYSVRSQMYMLTSHYDSALIWGKRALQMAIDENATEARIHSLNNLGTTLLMSGQLGGEVLLLESLERALADGFHEQAARAYTNLSSSMIMQCRFAEAERFCREGLNFDREHDLDSWTYYLLGLYAQLAAERGQFSLAQELAMEALTVPSQTAVMRWPPSLALGIARSRSGEADALTLLEDCLAAALVVGEAQLILPTCRALAEGYWLRGQADKARRIVEQGLTHSCKTDDPWLTGQLLVWGSRLGLNVQTGSRVAAPYQLELDGHLLEAASQWALLGAPFEQAVCLMRCGGVHLQKAADLFAQIGAHLALELTRAQARAQGVRGIKRGPYAAARDNDLGLTARELQIYELLANGMNNAEISKRLSRSVRTIEHHASKVLAKLGVRSRADLRGLPASTLVHFVFKGSPKK